MKTIKIIDKLYLNSGGVKSKTTNGRFQQVHLKQGDLDGACTAYSVMMILIAIGAINYSDVSIYKKHNKTQAKGRLIKEFLETKGLYREGAFYDEVQEGLQHSFAKIVKADWIETQGINSIEHITEKIEENTPVLISVSFSGGCHALVAVAVECDEDNKTTKILCLDPAFDAPKANYWNSVINVNCANSKDRYPYSWITEDDDRKVQLEDLVVIYKKAKLSKKA